MSDANTARFQRLLKDYGAALERLCSVYARDPDDRQDLMQDIAFALWRALPGFRGDCSERTFVFSIAHNRGLSHRWRGRPRGARLDESFDFPDPSPDPARLADRADQRTRLERALRSLPMPLRQCVALRLEGMRDAEIAEVVGISAGNVGVRLSRARRLLRVLLREEEP